MTSSVEAIGIDLGTSNCSISTYTTDGGLASVDIEQSGGVDVIEHKSLLPSALYFFHEAERSVGHRVSWSDKLSAPALAADGAPLWTLGGYARRQSALVPERVVTSAKSWLCNARVDRRGAILPWGAQDETAKIAPWEVSRRFLEHLRLQLGARGMAASEEVVLTVPASFDEAARSLTHDAALAAGFQRVLLLEEPQAAFYAWLQATGNDWRNEVGKGDLVLVCDVGGGTVDFTLIAVGERERQLELMRVSVGEHILLGGDNMDLALAYELKKKFETEGKQVGRWEFVSLVHAAREAKELLFSDESLAVAPISIAGRGSGLFRNTLSTELSRADAERVVVDGFFPRVSPTDHPSRQRSVGLRELGLEYASEAAITKHLARFLARGLEMVRSDDTLSAMLPTDAGASILKPTVVLFNGGVFKARALRARVLQLLSEWGGAEWSGTDVRELSGADLDLAVSRGAAYYGAVAREGKGIKIRAGTGRAYYLGVETSGLAVPGYTPPVRGICVVPRGTEEGATLALPGSEFGLVVGEPVEFRFFSSSVRSDGVGDVVEDAEAELDESARLEAALPPEPLTEGAGVGDIVPVTLRAEVTEVGTLDLYMQHTASERRWKLEFNVRGVEGQ